MLRQLIENIKKFVDYLFSKRSEVKDLDVKDGLLAKTVLDIHRKRSHSDFVVVPLYSLKQIHAIDRESAIKATERRAEILHKVREELLEEKLISRKILASYLPSISAIKVVRAADDSLIAFEGNGRLAAMQMVFDADCDLQVEVEEYHFRRSAKIIRRMNRVRRLNKLI